MATQTYPHIALFPDGVPYLSGTQTKVEEVVLDHLAHDWDADEMQRQHSDLTLAQIHSALAYYYDHQAEMDREIENGLGEVTQIRAGLGASQIRLKLKAKGLLP